MTDDFYEHLRDHFEDLFGERLKNLSQQFTKYAHCIVNGISSSSEMNRSQHSGYATAYWAINEGEKPQPYHCKIQFFFVVHLVVTSNEENFAKKREIALAYVNWLRPSTTRAVTERKIGLQSITKGFYAGDNFICVHRLVQRTVYLDVGHLRLVAELPC